MALYSIQRVMIIVMFISMCHFFWREHSFFINENSLTINLVYQLTKKHCTSFKAMNELNKLCVNKAIKSMEGISIK